MWPENCTDLDLPPPPPRVHITINLHCHIFIGIVSLRSELEVWCQIMTAKYLCDAIKNISMENLKGFAINFNLFATKFGAKCR